MGSGKLTLILAWLGVKKTRLTVQESRSLQITLFVVSASSDRRMRHSVGERKTKQKEKGLIRKRISEESAKPSKKTTQRIEK
jgi:hypothetical protein